MMGCIDQCRGFMGRLARDVRGNTLALMAAAMLPLAGLIGGGVDMSRLYLVKTRLQHACDAGALAGRKSMSSGSWKSTATNGATSDEAKAEAMFTANFSTGQFGTSNLTKNFTEANGTVSGVAGVRVPMTIMKVFGMQPRDLSVTCSAKMELPNTDVMFVLDVTYSMGCAPSATSDFCSQASVGSRRIDGLKKAVKCFYEALEKVATSEPCTFVSGTTYNSSADPTATTATTTAQVRIGFVPYGVNVNVGKILPNSMLADNWVYQTRVPNTHSEWAYTLGPESTISWPAWSGLPADLNDQSKYSGWTDLPTSPATVTINGVNKTVRPTGLNNSTCPALNTMGPSGNKLLDFADSPNLGAATLQSTTNNPPNKSSNPTQQTLTYNQSDAHSVIAYKYVWNTSSTPNTCRLQKSGTRNYTLTRNGGTSTKSITWNEYSGVFTDWTYKTALINVSGLKAGGSSWNNTVSLANMTTASGATVNLSNQSSATTLVMPGSASVTWDGCIEEAQTFKNTDGNPSDDWATLPSTAYDLNVNLIPNSNSTHSDWGSTVSSTIPWFTSSTSYGPGTYWGPMLAKTGGTNGTVYGAVWARYSGSATSWTQSNVTTTSDLDQDNYSYICTASPARRLAEYTTSGDFVSYVDSLNATDLGTYHDIGMLWGGRLLSPLGIFASDNALASNGGTIQRHLIFMTDGNTRTVYNNYNAYGLSYFNRYQFNLDATDTTLTDNQINARLINICNQIKNMNIQLWVVSYGSAVNTTTQDRLKACATDTNHFFSAADTPTLISNFQSIASKISALRLTS